MDNPDIKPHNLKDIDNSPDGIVKVFLKSIKSDVFKKENDLCNYIVENIELFVKDFLNDELVSFEVDKPIGEQFYFSPRGRRIDLFIKGKEKVYLIELKNPFGSTENRHAIGQILDYGREYLDSKKELLIITTMYDINTAKTIKYYNLPIRYIYLDKKRIMERYDN